MVSIENNSYYYSLNNVFHTISNKNIEIQNNILSQLNEKTLISQKYLLKYLHDLFEYHNIDYSIYHNTLLGFHLFQGIHIFYDHIELIMMYRNFQDLYKELKNDGFSIDFESKYLIVISSSFFDKIQIKAFIYFLHSDENNRLYHLSPHFIASSKCYKDLLIEKESFHLTFIPFHHIFPCKKVNYEDFQIFIPNQYLSILESLELKKDFYIFDSNHIKTKLLKKNNIEQEENQDNNPQKTSLSTLFSIFTFS